MMSADNEAPDIRGEAPDGEAQQLAHLAELVKILRARCPWDKRQTHLSLAPHLLEEAYETLDVIEALAAAEPAPPPNLVAHLQEELGDVLFQVFFHCELAAEQGRFTISEVARGVHDKLVGRHPHVFGDVHLETAEEVASRWEVLKRSEKERRGVADNVPNAMPALALASKLLKKADSLGERTASTSERAAELRTLADRLAAQSSEVPEDSEELARAVGAAAFALADLARTAGVDPEMALRAHALRFREELGSAG